MASMSNSFPYIVYKICLKTDYVIFLKYLYSSHIFKEKSACKLIKKCMLILLWSSLLNFKLELMFVNTGNA